MPKNISAAKSPQKSQPPNTEIIPPMVREYDIGGTRYIVKSIFVGKQDLQTKLLNLAERRAIREMGLDTAIP